MFDVAPTELMLVAVVALVVIGPKDLPKAMRVAGRWIAKAQGVARHFRSGLDEMVRAAELEEMEAKWAEENARIMREHLPERAPDATSSDAPSPDASLPADPAIDPSWDSEMRPLAQAQADAPAPLPADTPPAAPAELAPSPQMVIPFPADPAPRTTSGALPGEIADAHDPAAARPEGEARAGA